LEDLESSIEDILALFFHMLYLWTVAFLFLRSISFVDFLIRFPFLVRCFLLYIFNVLRGALRFQIRLNLLIKKKKNQREERGVESEELH
jgi:hypothetical protein